MLRSSQEDRQAERHGCSEVIHYVLFFMLYVTVGWHSGELMVQERAGEAVIARRNGSAISGNVMVGARPF
jgi:hypothetical protein